LPGVTDPNVWSGRASQFVGNLVLFFNIDLPAMLAVELLTRGQDWDDDEEEDNDEA
jgi:hypothetical protein